MLVRKCHFASDQASSPRIELFLYALSTVHTLIVMLLGWFIIVSCIIGIDGSGIDAPPRQLTRPISFSFPPNCTKDHKPANSSFCATGALDIGLKWFMNFDTYIFDIFHPDKTVLFGINLTIDKGVPEGFAVRTGGCAVPLYYDLLRGLSPDLLQLATKICTSSSSPGKYDPSTKGFSAHFDVSGDTGLYTHGQRSALPFLPFNATGHAYVNPHFDVGLNVTIERSGGIPKEFQVTISFTNSIHSVNGSIFTWRLYSGFIFNTHTPQSGNNTVSKTFVDKIIQIKSPF